MEKVKTFDPGPKKIEILKEPRVYLFLSENGIDLDKMTPELWKKFDLC